MSTDSFDSQLQQQADLVRKLKAEKSTSQSTLTEAINKLNLLKQQIAAQQTQTNHEKDAEKQMRTQLEDLLIRRFFYVPSFEIYGGVGGLYDFGPTGCAVKQNLLAQWRRHFVLEEQMLEVDCASMTPEVVLKTSGHVDKFTDLMVRDTITLDCHRADKLLEETIDLLVIDTKKPLSQTEREEALKTRAAAGGMSAAELSAALKKYNVRAPDTNNELSEPFPFNLMFQTSIGPTGKFVGYLRPETAQGIFVNFRRLLDFNAGKMPFAAAQIGLAFRNEIAPRAGLLRVREFTLAEIEHFVKPDDKRHTRFEEVANLTLSLLDRSRQTGENQCVEMTVSDAVHKHKLINNETLAYFMARTHLFLLSLGIKREKLRFRQHLSNEMAHYASDCWDAEIHGSYGWIECVGHADRAAYDLRVHSEKSKVDLVALEVYSEPRMMEIATVTPNPALIGKTFGKTAKPLIEHLKQLQKEEALELKKNLENGSYELKLCDGNKYRLTKEMVKIIEETKKVSSMRYTPSVIEPSFGIGRILYHVFEHAYTVKTYTTKGRTEQRHSLALPVNLSPVKVVILPISNNAVFQPFETQLLRSLTKAGVVAKLDNSGSSIGKRYARFDEIGTNFALTIDFQTVEDQTVTIRDRDSTQQLRMSIDQAIELTKQLVDQTIEWSEIYNSGKYEQVQRPEADE